MKRKLIQCVKCVKLFPFSFYSNQAQRENPEMWTYLNFHTHITCHLAFSNLSDAIPETPAIPFFFNSWKNMRNNKRCMAVFLEKKKERKERT